MRTAGALFVSIILSCVGISRSASAQDQVYRQPRLYDDRLDWCQAIGTVCGYGVALQFCKERRFEDVAAYAPCLAHGFPGVFHFKLDPEAGRSPTQVISTGQVCTGPVCRGFQMIVCQKRK